MAVDSSEGFVSPILIFLSMSSFSSWLMVRVMSICVSVLMSM